MICYSICFTVLFWFVLASSSSSDIIPEDSLEDFKACTAANALVVSEIFCLPSDYRKDVPPPISPIKVFFKLVVSEVSKIDDQRSQISIRWTYKLMWPETRMILNSSADWSFGEINVRGDMVDHFWTPDIIIHDLVSFYKPEILNQVAALEIKRKKKTLYYKIRSDMTMVCKGMKFSRFPLDEHVCYLKLTSFGYDDRKMMLAGQFDYEEDNQRALPFNVRITEISKEMKTHHGSTSNYSVWGMEIKLSRCVSPYMLNVYLPTAIFVVMSWVSFLIPTDVVPARIVLLVTLCLVIINTFNNVTARIPVASQVTALEIWLLACILLVFGALAEYAFILRQVIQLSRKERRKRQLANQPIAPPSGLLGSSYLSNPAHQEPAKPRTNDFCIHPSNPRPPTRCGHTSADMAAASSVMSAGNSNGAPSDEWSEKTMETLQVCLETHQMDHLTVRTADFGAQVSSKNKHYEDDSKPPRKKNLILTHNDEMQTKSRLLQSEMSESKKPKKTPDQLLRRYQEHVDGKALIVFPVAFILFNIGYWSHYLLNKADL